MNKIIWNQRGFMALISVLIVSAISLVIVSSLTVNFVGERKVLTESINARNAFYLAYGCSEEWLMRIRRDLNYQSWSLVIDANNNCQTSITAQGINLKLIATGESYQSKKQIEVIFNITSETSLLDEENVLRNRNNINILSWREI